jgi:hypothetical protein
MMLVRALTVQAYAHRADEPVAFEIVDEATTRLPDVGGAAADGERDRVALAAHELAAVLAHRAGAAERTRAACAAALELLRRGQPVERLRQRVEFAAACSASGFAEVAK